MSDEPIGETPARPTDVAEAVASKPQLAAIVIQCMTDFGLNEGHRPRLAMAVLDAYTKGLNDALAPVRELLLTSQE